MHMIARLLVVCSIEILAWDHVNAAGDYEFKGGYPTPETVQRAYDDADLNRAIQAYRFFYPTVSGAAIFKGNAQIGVKPNTVFGTLDTKPKHIGFTLNSDTPYAPLLMDLKNGPIVVEVPKGPLIVAAMDMNQRWVASQWIKTIPGKGWFVYLRIYGPESAGFDGSWRPGDFEQVK